MEGHDVCGNIEFDSVAILRSNISGPDSRRPGQDYRKLEDRMKSFNFWPPGMPVESKDLAEAGLYYTGKMKGRFMFRRYNPEKLSVEMDLLYVGCMLINSRGGSPVNL
jgi:hypothetical protein